jgi:dihydrofolate synthase/folylpolyglutamate synthase
MTYEQTLDFLFSQLPAYHRIGKAAYKNNLDNTRVLDEHFNHPHRNYKTIHIAGTNGKGSVSHIAASVLQEAGYRTGLYTSPHLKDFRERIRVNGEMISKREVIAFVKNNRSIIDLMKPSFFEMCVAMAFDYFAKREVDIAVIETGLGGRLDSTNIITPVVSVITNIGHDHFDLLGGSLVNVAGEKAGIIKKNVPVIIGETQPEVKSIFTEKASDSGSHIIFADDNFNCELEKYCSRDALRKFAIRDLSGALIAAGVTPMPGDYQEKNIATVFQLFTSVKDTLNISQEVLLRGIKGVVANTGMQGRWQVLSRTPLTICDTAHNREGLEFVIRQLSRIGSKKMHMVIGFVSDKDLAQVLPLFPVGAKYYYTRASVPRAMDENILRDKASEYRLTGESYTSVKEAFAAARHNAGTEDIIFVGGSTFVVAEVI